MHPEIKYLLLDLDGTLIHFDMNEFVARYLKMITQHFISYSWADQVAAWILEGTDLMLNNPGPESNQTVFLRFFSSKSGLSEKELWDYFIHFYETDFESLHTITDQDQSAIEFIEQAISREFQLVLATQPIFPEIAIRKRLKWAGLAHIPFSLITDIEKMSAAKPALRYFNQILNLTGADPENCLMIGNDPVTDMAAKKTGIKTFYLSRVEKLNDGVLADYQGGFELLVRLLGWS